MLKQKKRYSVLLRKEAVVKQSRSPRSIGWKECTHCKDVNYSLLTSNRNKNIFHHNLFLINLQKFLH